MCFGDNSLMKRVDRFSSDSIRHTPRAGPKATQGCVDFIALSFLLAQSELGGRAGQWTSDPRFGNRWQARDSLTELADVRRDLWTPREGNLQNPSAHRSE